MDDRRIDARIDEAARELTEAAPSGDLKGRVLARIAAVDADRSWPLAVRLAPAAALVAAVLLWPERPGGPASQVRPAPSSSTTGSVIPEAQPQREADAPLITRPGAALVQQPRSAPARAATRDLGRPNTRELAPEPLAIAAIAIDRLAVPESAALGPLEVTGLIVTRLEIEPISPQGELQ